MNLLTGMTVLPDIFKVGAVPYHIANVNLLRVLKSLYLPRYYLGTFRLLSTAHVFL